MSDAPTKPLPTGLDPSRPRRRRRGWIVLAVVVIVLAALLVVADRAAASYARQRLSEVVAERAGATGGRVEQVEIGGFPFLTQAVGGRYDSVRVVVRNVGAAGLTADRLRITATGVRLPLGDLLAGTTANGSADRLDAAAVIPISALAAGLAPRGVRMVGENDGIRINAPASLAGYTGTITGLARFEVANGQLSIRLSSLSAAGYRLPPPVAQTLSRQLSKLVRAPALPYGLKLTTVRVLGPNIEASASGTAVRLR